MPRSLLTEERYLPLIFTILLNLHVDGYMKIIPVNDHKLQVHMHI